MPARVFVVNETLRRTPGGQLERALDLSPALEFGQLYHVLPAGQPPADPSAMISAINKSLDNFTDDDYLLLVGHPAAIGAAVAIASQKTGGSVKVLRWAGRERKYQVLLLPIPPQKVRIDHG